MAGIARVIILASLTTAQWFGVDRHDQGDIYGWHDISEDTECNEYTSWPDAGRCHCNWGLTFSTEDNKCLSYRNQGK